MKMESKNGRPLKLLSGSANAELAVKISNHLNAKISPAIISTFSDGESQIEIHDNMRGCDVFVIQPTCPPVNHNVMELYLILDALKRSDCWHVTAVIPYFGYGRQDRKIKPRVPISAKAVSDILSLGGVSRILTIDLHSGQIQGFFDCPVDHLYGSKVFIEHIRETAKPDTVLLSPDGGGTDRVFGYAKKLDLPMATTFKKRSGPNEIEKMIILGEIKNRHVIIIDDMVDTAGTLCNVAHLAMNSDAKSVTAYATHGILSGAAAKRIQESCIKKMYVTDTVPLPESCDLSSMNCNCNKVERLSVAPLFAEAIRNIHKETSVSCLFD
jgi:ribose-phosphate pyrophosphokinase